jgi:hypothetical protein
MQVICCEDEAFFMLIERVVERIKEKYQVEDKWVSGQEAMRLLRISSKTTLQKLRDKGRIRFSQPQSKIILYDRESLLKYLDKNAKETF